MPIRMFIDPTTQERISPELAAQHFHDHGIMPGQAVSAILADEFRENRTGTHISPSIMNGEKTCRREIVIKRFLPYDQDPLVLWEAVEGTVWHEALAAHDHSGWHRELSLPSEADASHPKVRLIVGSLGSFYQVEVFPGIWMHGTADMVSPDYGIIEDIKTTRYPWTPKPDGIPRDFIADQLADWTYQVNIYGLMIEILKGVRPKEQWAWRIYRGSRNRVYTFRKVAVPILSAESVWERIKDHATSLNQMLLETSQQETEEARRDYIKVHVPMDGEIKRIFRGDKCLKYCSVREQCFAMAGRMDF